MNTFSVRGANHYCGSFEPRAGIAEQSPEEFRQTRLRQSQSITEGTGLFDEYRACALRDSERSLFLAASHYRRALDLMIPTSSHWAHVTLYYGAFFAARALLGMFGCGVFHKNVVHVSRSSPGNQELRVERIGSHPGGYFVTENGSHKRFWEIFYRTVGPVRKWVDSKYRAALVPVSSSNTWLIEQRNSVNYKTTESLSITQSFSRRFRHGSFPDSLPGALQTQFKVSEGILAASSSFANKFGLATDALDFLDASASFTDMVRDHVHAPGLPDLVSNSNWNDIFGA